MYTYVQLTCDTHVIAMARLVTGESMATSYSSTDTVDCSPSVSGVESDTSSTSCSCTSVPSLLDRLKAPQKSQLARKSTALLGSSGVHFFIAKVLFWRSTRNHTPRLY